MRFSTVVELHGRSATGLPVPAEVLAGLDAGKRPAVTVTLRGYSYRTTVGSMGGRILIPLSAEHRAAAGVAAGEEVDVDIEVDAAARDVELPDDLARALADDEAARGFFATLAPSHRKEWVRWVQEAKRAETRSARIERTVQGLREGRKTH